MNVTLEVFGSVFRETEQVINDRVCDGGRARIAIFFKHFMRY